MTTNAKNKLFLIFRQLKSSNQQSFEFNVTDLNFEEKESVRYSLMNKGIRAEFYTELGKSLMGVWV